MKPGELNNQGTAVVDSYPDGYYLLLPDGTIAVKTSRAAVTKTVKAWAKKNADASKVNVCKIEWR